MFNKGLALSVLLLAGFASSANACDRQRILAIGGGCYEQQAFIQPVYAQQQCVQQFVQPVYGVQQFVQPVYGYSQGFSGFRQGLGFGGGGLNLNFGNQNFRRGGGRPIILPRRGFRF